MGEPLSPGCGGVPAGLLRAAARPVPSWAWRGWRTPASTSSAGTTTSSSPCGTRRSSPRTWWPSTSARTGPSSRCRSIRPTMRGTARSSIRSFATRQLAHLETTSASSSTSSSTASSTAGACDFHAEFSVPLPGTVFLPLAGLAARRPRRSCSSWKDEIIRPAAFTPGRGGRHPPSARPAGRSTSYFEEAIDERRGSPRPRHPHRFLDAEVDGSA